MNGSYWVCILGSIVSRCMESITLVKSWDWLNPGTFKKNISKFAYIINKSGICIHIFLLCTRPLHFRILAITCSMFYLFFSSTANRMAGWSDSTMKHQQSKWHQDGHRGCVLACFENYSMLWRVWGVVWSLMPHSLLFGLLQDAVHGSALEDHPEDSAGNWNAEVCIMMDAPRFTM